MNTPTLGIVAAVVASFLAGSASAQNTFTGTGTGLGQSVVEDRNEDLAEAIEEDFERDIDRFGNEGRALGFDGSVALRATAATGNDEAASVGIGANLGYFDGVNGYELSLAYAYVESEDRFGNTSTDTDSLLYEFQYTRDFNPELYGFVMLQGAYTGDEDEGEIYYDSEGNQIVEDVDAVRENDVFLGFGAGYRILNTPDAVWAVQAGPGYRFANFSDIDDAIVGGDLLDDDINEAALSISSNYFNRISETVFLTNDTDIITSESDTVLYNDLGVNVAMSDALALRTSIQSEYHTDRVPGEEATDHIVGVSLVYNFN